MKVSNFSDAQKSFILKQGDDGVPVASLFARRVDQCLVKLLHINICQNEGRCGTVSCLIFE
ncbi:hypothetical protein GAO09_06920 [Rhizobiales bacterium RZME27]|uniref:Uncharacterized protein n=1 Tax=Endobacterium cereale TaxID=2663029 RepID=A0A6A8A4L3_9HYPH|nr:hypothetical protein [Endobacterium cereale]